MLGIRLHHKKDLVLVITLLTLSSCSLSMPNGWGSWYTPRPLNMRGIPDTSTPYGQGFHDGCRAHMALGAEGALRNLPFKYDGYRLSTDRAYANGVVDGEEHCFYFWEWDVT